MSLLSVQGLTRSFGGVRAVQEFAMSVTEGETLGIIGPNGAGKTTLFNLITGTDLPDSGTILFDGEDITRLGADKRARRGIIRTFQHGRVFANLSVLDNVLSGAHIRREAAQKPNFLLTGFAELSAAFLPWGPRMREEKALRNEATDLLSLFGERLIPRLHDPAFSLSYANRRRLEIARALFARPRLLFLDEPTAGMNPSETVEMVEFLFSLKNRGQTMVIIEHKLPLILPLSDRVAVMDEGRKIAEDKPNNISLDPKVIEAYLGHGRGILKNVKEETPHEPADDSASFEVY